MISSVCWRGPCAVLLLCSPLLANSARAQISLYSAVDLARRNSTSIRIALADVDHAQAAESEARDAYVPSLLAGSSAGYSYGFPVGEPTVFNFQAQSLVISFSQPDYIRAARAALNSATLNLKDALDQIDLQTALDYLQLSSIHEELSALDEEKSYAERLDVIEQDRLTAGVESRIAATKAELNAAQADLKRLDLQSQAAVLREQLSNLTGLPVEDIEAEPQTVPAPPLNVINPAPRLSSAVAASYSNAVSKHYVAHGDKRLNYRPQIGFGFNYQLFDTSINDYNQYYQHPLQANNFSVGVQVTFPLFNASNSARARASAAEAVQADAQAEQARQREDENVLQLQKNLPTLTAQAKIASLQEQLAGEQLQSVLLQMRAAPASPNTAPVTPADEMEARISERSRFSDAIEARFTLLKAQLSLLRLTGGLRSWINQGAK